MTNLYKLNPHFGTESDFISLISSCHEKDIWVMVDIVVNHVGLVGTDYSRIYPFNSSEHYHNVCQIEIGILDDKWKIASYQICQI